MTEDWADVLAEQTIKSLKGMKIPAWQEMPSDGIISEGIATALRKAKADGMREVGMAMGKAIQDDTFPVIFYGIVRQYSQIAISMADKIEKGE